MAAEAAGGGGLGVPVRLVGWAHLVVTLGAVGVLVSALGHWWPRGSAWYLVAGAAGVVLLVAGLWWAVGAWEVLVRGRRWSRQVVVWPLVAVVGVGVALWGRPDFAGARPQFEGLAEEMLAEPGRTLRGPVRGGAFPGQGGP